MMNTSEFKILLDEEKAKLEKDLQAIGHTIDASGDWVADAPEPDTHEEDPNVQADRIEALETNIATVTVLEVQYRKVVDALARINAGTYGLDENTGEPIPVERLRAVPTATTAIPINEE